jgi:dynein heavy chain
VNDFVSLAIKMPRLDTGTGDYLVEIRDQFELFGSIQAICHQLNEIEKACADFIEQYSSFAFLWKEDLDTFFSKFLEQGKDLKDTFEADLALRAPDMEEVQIQVERENFDQMIKKIYNGVATKQPALEKFDEQIQHLSEIKHQIKSMKETDNVGWLKVDSTPIKTELTDTI